MKQVIETKTKKTNWILLVEDDDDLRESVKDYIEDSFGELVKIVEVRNGAEATTKISFQAFNCIVTDLKMPKKDGKAFLKSVKQNTLNAHTPIIVISGTGTVEIEKEFSFVNFLAKPFEFDQFIDLLRTNLNIKSNKKRLSAHLFNDIVYCVHQFSQTIDKSVEYTIGTAKVLEKEELEEISQYNFYIKVRMNEVTNYFSILSNQDCISSLINNTSLKGKINNKNFFTAMCSSIFNVIKRFNPQLVITNVECIEKQELKNSIAIPIYQDAKEMVYVTAHSYEIKKVF